MELGLRLHEEVTSYKYPLLVMVLAGPHAQGFGTATTPFELRGCHVVPLEEVLGLVEDDGIVRHFDKDPAPGIDVLTHDVRRLVASYLHGSWQALELILAPEPIHSTPQIDELRQIIDGRIWRSHVASYRAAGSSLWLLAEKSRPRRVEQVLAVYRTLLTAIHAAATGQVEIRLPRLVEVLEQNDLVRLIERGQAESADAMVDDAELAEHRKRVEGLLQILEAAGQALETPDPSVRQALSDFVVRTRLQWSLASWSARLGRVLP